MLSKLLHSGKTFIFSMASAVALTGCSSESNPTGPHIADLNTFDILAGGKQIRMVWVDATDSNIMIQNMKDPAPSVFYHGEIDEMSWPLISTNGDYVLFGSKKRIMAGNWGDITGSSIRKLKTGYCPVAVWCDPPTGREWVYYLTPHPQNPLVNMLRRFQLRDPSIDEIVWDKTPADYPFSLSKGGTFGAGQFPWPDCGLINMVYTETRAVIPNGTFYKAEHQGCNSNIFPDNSYRMFHVNSGIIKWNGIDYPNHGGIFMYDKVTEGEQKAYGFIPLSVDGKEIHRARITNSSHYFTFFGPAPWLYNLPRDIFIAKFNKNFTDTAMVARVTSSAGIDDAAPYAWIEGPDISMSTDTPGICIEDSSISAETLDVTTKPVELLSPTEGDVYIAGDTMHVIWKDDGKSMIGAILMISLNNGKSFVQMNEKGAITRTDSAWGDFSWIIPDSIYDPGQNSMISISSSQCYVKITDYNSFNIEDLSPVFVIKEQAF